ncbi:MAG: hypothetical protein AB7V48_12265 [Sedimentibacter sp.]
MKPKYTKVNRSVPDNKINTDRTKTVNSIRGINNINTSVSSNKDIAKHETDDILAYIMQESIEKSKKVKNIEPAKKLKDSISSSYTIKLEMEDHSAIAIKKATEVNTIEIKEIEVDPKEIVNLENSEDSVSSLNIVESVMKDLSSNVVVQEAADDSIETKDISHIDNLEDLVPKGTDTVNPEADSLSAYVAEETDEILNKIGDTDHLSNIESSGNMYAENIEPEMEDVVLNNMAQESINDICKTVSAMSYESSVSPPKNNNMRGVDFNMATCDNDNLNCTECCQIFIDPDLRTAFGYQIEEAVCQCHDICVQDVRDICVELREFRQTVPCNINGGSGCRGGFSPNGVPTVDSFRVDCAEECLNPPTCDRITNEVEFQVILDYNGTKAIMTFSDTFDCLWFEFARFPSGVFYTNDAAGLADFQAELALIDGSCKVIIFERVEVVQVNGNCELQIDYKVIDKLWKEENLLVSAIKPYGEDNITVKQEFLQGHQIGPCPGGPCNNG